MSSVFTSVLPNNYRKKDCPYLYNVPNGIDHSFYINDSAPVTNTFANLRLSVFDVEGNEVISNASSLSQVSISGGYQVYAEDVNITGLVGNKTYRYIIYDTSDDSIVYILNWFKFTNEVGGLVKVSYRNSSDIFNFEYETLSTYRNEIFLDLNVVDNQTELERTGYTEVSTGFYRNQKSQVKEYFTLESYFFDDVAHGGMRGLSAHDDIEINGRPYQVKENYETEYSIRNGQFKGTMDFWDQANNEINLNK